MRMLVPLLLVALVTAGLVVYLLVTSPDRAVSSSRRARVVARVAEEERCAARLAVADARSSRAAGDVVAVLQDPVLDSLPAQASAELVAAHADVSKAAEAVHADVSVAALGRYEAALDEVEEQVRRLRARLGG